MMVKASCASKKSQSAGVKPLAANAFSAERRAAPRVSRSARPARAMVSVAAAAAAILTARCAGRTASRAHTTTAAAPSHTGATSSTPMGSATSGDNAWSSAEIGSRNMALGLPAALRWASRAKGAKSSRAAPVSCM